MCQDCFNNCNGQIISDKCVRYAGEDVPILGIEKGQPLSQVEEIIIDKLIAQTNGTGILLSQITLDCSFISDLLSTKDKTLANLIQVLIASSCSLRSLVASLSAQVNTIVSFDTSCLEVPSSPSKDQILQAAIKKICSISADVALIKADYVKATQLNTLIQQYLSTQTGATVQNYTKMVPYTAVEYYGPLSNFDAFGKGLAAQGFDRVYLCNGANGTPDKRGRVTVGAVAGVPGGALDADVDPALIINAGMNYALKDKFGENATILTIAQLPPHSHSINDPGHKHLTGSGWAIHSDTDGAGSGISNSGHDAVDFDTKTNDGLQSSPTGISINTTGSGQPHDNRQPSIAAYYIMYIPS